MRQRRRWRRALAVLALVVVVAVLLLRTERAGALVCETLRERLPGVVGAPVSIARCEVDPLSLSVRAREVAVLGTAGATPRLEADEASVSLRGLFLGGVSLQRVQLVRPRVAVVLPEATPLAQGAQAEECPLAWLERVRIAELGIENGTFSVEDAQGRSLKLDGVDVTARLGRRLAEVDAQVRSGFVSPERGRLLALGRVGLEASLDVSQREVEVERLDANVEGVSLGLSGVVSALCSPAPGLEVSGQVYLPLKALDRLGLKLPPPSGQVWGRLSVTGTTKESVVRADVRTSQVALGPFKPGDVSARVTLREGVLQLDELSTRAGDGEVRLTGHVQLSGSFPTTLNVDARGASLARVLDRAGIHGAWVEFPASAKGTLTGRLLPTPQLSGDVGFSAGHFTLAARPWDAPVSEGRTILNFEQGEGAFHFGLTSEGVAFDDVSVSVGAQKHTRVQGSVKLYFDPARGLDVHAWSDSVDLSDFGHISGLAWRGVGGMRADIGGPFKHITVDGQATLRDFNFDGYALGVLQSPIHYASDTLSFPGIVGQKGQTQYFGELALLFRDTGLHTRAAVQLPAGRVEDLVDLLAELSTTVTNVQGDLFGRVSAVAAVDSPASELTGTMAFRFSDVSYLDRRMGEANMIARFEGGEALVVEPTVFDGPLGRTSVSGRWDWDGPLDYRVGVDQGSLKELVDPSGKRDLPVGGAFTFQGKVGGDTDVVRTEAWIRSDDVRWNARSLGPMHLEATSVARDIQAFGTIFPGLQGKLSLQARNEWNFTTNLTLALADASAFLPSSAGPLKVGLEGTLTAAGPMKHLGQVRAAAALSKVTVQRNDLTAQNTEPVELAFDAGAVEVRSLVLNGPTTELSAQGRWGPGTVDLKTRGSLDLRLLESFAPKLERTSGRLDFTAVFSGPVDKPALSGNGRVDDVRFAVRGEDLTVRALSGNASFSESRILLQDWNGFLNDGRLRARGDVRLDRLSLKSMEVQTDLEEVTVQVQPDVPATFSGSLLLASRDEGPWQLAGALEVVRLRYTQPLQLESVLAKARARGVPSDERPTEWLHFDVDVSAGNDVRVENNLARARLLGKVKLAGTNVNPVLIGALEVGEGAQAYFRNNTYAVERASLQFNGLWPTFDLAAQSQVREYLVKVKAFGRFDDPRVLLSAEPALAEADIVSLLTLGVTRSDRFANESGAGLAAEALMSYYGWDQQLQRFLARGVGLKDQQVRLTTSFNEATGTAEPTVNWESKLGSENWKVGVTQPVVTGRGTRAQVEYRFNPRVSTRFSWDNQTQTTSFGNPGLDLRLQFEWE